MPGSIFSWPRPRLIHISIGSVHILLVLVSVSISVSDSVNEPYGGTAFRQRKTVPN